MYVWFLNGEICFCICNFLCYPSVLMITLGKALPLPKRKVSWSFKVTSCLCSWSCWYWKNKNPWQDTAHTCSRWRSRRYYAANWSHFCTTRCYNRTNQNDERGNKLLCMCMYFLWALIVINLDSGFLHVHVPCSSLFDMMFLIYCTCIYAHC